jgi:hypothetical protein
VFSRASIRSGHVMALHAEHRALVEAVIESGEGAAIASEEAEVAVRGPTVEDVAIEEIVGRAVIPVNAAALVRRAVKATLLARGVSRPESQ